MELPYDQVELLAVVLAMLNLRIPLTLLPSHTVSQPVNQLAVCYGPPKTLTSELLV
jgi:hypothetical protein